MILSYAQACAVVAAYNEMRCVRRVARKVRLPVDVVRAAADWLWNRTFHKETVIVAAAMRTPQIRITEETWCEFLYTMNASPEDAAESLSWPIERVMSSCGDARQWRKTQGRKPLYARACAVDTQPREGDPAEDEIYARAAELRKTWAPGDARLKTADSVEIPEYSVASSARTRRR